MRGSLKALSDLRDKVLAWRNCRHDRSNVTSLVSHNTSYIIDRGEIFYTQSMRLISGDRSTMKTAKRWTGVTQTPVNK